jgi:hypothetical protein
MESQKVVMLIICQRNFNVLLGVPAAVGRLSGFCETVKLDVCLKCNFFGQRLV